jgi:hypothetical protein
MGGLQQLKGGPKFRPLKELENLGWGTGEFCAKILSAFALQQFASG